MIGAAVAALVAVATVLVALPASGFDPTITGTQFTATAGQSFTQSIAQTSGIVGEVSVNWGDGVTDSDTVQPDGSVPATHTYAQEADYDVTISAGGATAHTTVFVLSPTQSGALGSSDITTVPPGGSGGATTTGITGTLTHSGTAPGPAVLLVAVYGANPQPVPVDAFSFFDVRVTGGAAEDVLVVVFQYAGNAVAPTQLLFFDPATNSYQPVHASSLAIDTSAHTVTVTFDGSSTPSITSLTGTVFAVAPLRLTPRFTG